MTAEVHPIRTAAETGLVESFDAALATLPGTPEIARERKRAFDAVKAAGLPHRRLEAWKYTDLRAALREALPLAGVPTPEAILEARTLAARQTGALDAWLVLVVNGHLAVTPEAPIEGLSIQPLAEALSAGDPALARYAEGTDGNAIVALNTAFAADGVLIRVAEGAAIGQPLHVAVVQSGPASAAHVRVVVELGAGASLTLVESHASDDEAHQATSVVEARLGDGATLGHVKLQDVALKATHLSATRAALGAKARFGHLSVAAGAALARAEIHIAFEGEGATADSSAIALAAGRRHLDTTLVATHSAENCVSRELFKVVLADEARAVFQGKIIVDPGAQKTDGKMMLQALMLNEGPEADLKPELEIFADDVVCGHGATAGEIDEELLFYLMARGIPKGEAQALLVEAFLGEVVEKLEDEPLRETVSERVRRWLAAKA